MWPFRFDGNGGVAACPPGYAVARPAFAAVRFLVGEVDWRPLRPGSQAWRPTSAAPQPANDGHQGKIDSENQAFGVRPG
jgi:hypothetical protein